MPYASFSAPKSSLPQDELCDIKSYLLLKGTYRQWFLYMAKQKLHDLIPMSFINQTTIPDDIQALRPLVLLFFFPNN